MNPSRARGVLWGQAVGDALGTTVEFLDELSVATRAEAQWPRDVIGGGPFRLVPGQITDDTELALTLARSLARECGYDDDEVAAAYCAWLASDPPDRGMATTRAFGGAVQGFDVAAQVRARASMTTEANGALMRSSPLGLYGVGMNRTELGALAARDATLSHPALACQHANAVFVTTIADAVNGERTGPELFDRALEFARSHAPTVVSTLEAARLELPVSDGANQGWVRIALQHAFFHLLHAREFETALVATVVKGGDADTNGCVVGALLGAALGVDSIPSRWRDTVAKCVSPRPRDYRCDDLDALTQRLVFMRTA